MSAPCNRKVNRKHPAPLSDHPTRRSHRMSDRSIAKYLRGRDKITEMMGRVWQIAAIKEEKRNGGTDSSAASVSSEMEERTEVMA